MHQHDAREDIDRLTDTFNRSRQGVEAILRGDRLKEPCRRHAWRGHYTASRHNR